MRVGNSDDRGFKSCDIYDVIQAKKLEMLNRLEMSTGVAGEMLKEM